MPRVRSARLPRMEGMVPIPSQGRTFVESRRVRLTDMDPQGRLRLDAIARFLQEIAIDDVDETGWGTPDHLWFVRRMRIDVVEPFLADRGVELVTWCSGLSTVAAGRRWSLTGDRGGRIEVDSVWIHLDPDQRPARITRFDAYARAACGRRVSAKPQLADPATDGPRSLWPLRASDVDLHGHVNNTVYWQAIEHVLLGAGPEPRRPLRARLEFREPLDLGDRLELAVSGDEHHLAIGFVADGRIKAVAAITDLRKPARVPTAAGHQPVRQR
jgi:acyl-ACP thioesterase